MGSINRQGMELAARAEMMQMQAEAQRDFIMGTRIDVAKSIFLAIVTDDARRGLAEIHEHRKAGNLEAANGVEFEFDAALNIARAATNAFMVGMGLQKPRPPKPEEPPAETNGEAKSSIIVTG